MDLRPITDMLLCVDEDDPFKYQSRKMISKMRDIFRDDPLYAFYREFPSKMYSQEQKEGEMMSFLVQSLIYNN